MAVSIVMPRQKEAGFDKFLRRLGGVVDVANSGIGAYSNIKGIQEKNRLAEAAKIKAEEDALGIYGQKELDPKDWINAKEGEQGAQKFKVKGANGVEEKFMRRYEAQAKAKSAEEIENTKADTAYKYAQAKKLGTEGNSLKSEWEKLAPPDQDLARDLSKRNASKIAIKNQIDAVMSGWDNLSSDQKITQGRQLIKVLNSSEGADAVGSEEAKRLGGKLEFAMGNFTNSNPTQFGRDLDGFKEQAVLTSAGLGSAINANQEQIRRIAGPAAGKGLSDLVKEKTPSISNEDKKAIEWAMSNPNDPRSSEILKKNNANIAR